MRHILGRGLALGFAVTLATAGLVALPTPVPAMADPVPGLTIFEYTGAPQSYVVPQNVDAILVHVLGGGGGSSASAQGPYGVSSVGGAGGSVITLLQVVPGQTLQINVGGVGQPGGGVSGDGSQIAHGGWNGGGSAGFGQATQTFFWKPWDGAYLGTVAGGGGGASDIRICATASAGTCPLAARVVVAGGGGGAGADDGSNSASMAGGAGGYFEHGDGATAVAETDLGVGNAGPGEGATQSHGGAGGVGANLDPRNDTIGNCQHGALNGAGAAGGLGRGGAGGGNALVPNDYTNYGGGGGGGGYYGGGGGGCGGYTYVQGLGDNVVDPGTAGGGGGSSWADPALTSGTSYAPTTLRNAPGRVVLFGVRFGSPAEPQVFTAPPESSHFSLRMTGASGGGYHFSGAGGGATLSGPLNIGPGDVLQFDIGGGGSSAVCPDSTCEMTWVGATPGYMIGWNGGGSTSGDIASDLWAMQAGGGGASDMRVCATASTHGCGHSDRIAVAAGGGGGAEGTGAVGYEGAGGCAQGSYGVASFGAAAGGASLVAGGTAGTTSVSGADAGWAGEIFSGGAGGAGDEGFADSFNGSGGGGGLYGGGGGGGGNGSWGLISETSGGGGGGSSLWLGNAIVAGITCTPGTLAEVASGQSIDGSALIGYEVEVPSVPVDIVAATANTSSATLAFTPGPDYGGSITKYHLLTSIDGVTWVPSEFTGSPTSPLTITGLDSATNYRFRIALENSSGVGPYSAVSNLINTGGTPAPSIPTVPGTPSAEAQANAVALTWSAPTSDGGSPITDNAMQYSTNCTGTYDGMIASTGSTLPSAVVTGLDPSKSYCFQVAAKNVTGLSAWSSASTAVYPIGVPTTPSVSSATADFESVSLAWSAATIPGAPGNGQAVSGYELRWSTDGGTTWTDPMPTGSTATSFVVGALRSTSPYVFQVRAVNNDTVGLWSTSSNSVNPGTPATAPRDLTGSPGKATVTLTWDAPANLGGGSIVGYSIQMKNNSSSANTWQVLAQNTESSATSFVVSGLSNGVPYGFRVRAITLVDGGDRPSPLSVATRGIVPRSGTPGPGPGPGPTPTPTPTVTSTVAPTPVPSASASTSAATASIGGVAVPLRVTPQPGPTSRTLALSFGSMRADLVSNNVDGRPRALGAAGELSLVTPGESATTTRERQAPVLRGDLRAEFVGLRPGSTAAVELVDGNGARHALERVRVASDGRATFRSPVPTVRAGEASISFELRTRANEAARLELPAHVVAVPMQRGTQVVAGPKSVSADVPASDLARMSAQARSSGPHGKVVVTVDVTLPASASRSAGQAAVERWFDQVTRAVRRGGVLAKPSLRSITLPGFARPTVVVTQRWSS